MHVEPTALPDVLLIRPRLFRDDRGFFLETFQARKYAAYGIPSPLVQDNYSGSKKGVLRGLHYQIDHAQGKLIGAAVGRIFDVAVDLRRSSPTFGKWVGMELTAEHRQQLWIPPGFAHGFLVLSDWAEVAYKTTDFYHPQAERTLAWNDPAVGIAWPLAAGQTPLLSPKDAQGTTLDRAEVYP